MMPQTYLRKAINMICDLFSPYNIDSITGGVSSRLHAGLRNKDTATTKAFASWQPCPHAQAEEVSAGIV